ncbi:MAG: class I SAM-dependent methyltransferase [Gammaproteobacteria bacterium]|nr:class I SAM-dependent methyltransferase [Gammaproteobacteria bacterium]
MKVDFGKTSDDYALHRSGFPASFYETLTDMGITVTGALLLDVGTGTGTLARGFAKRGASVIAIDPSVEMLHQAAKLGEANHIEFREGTAEATGCEAGSLDIAAAGQCWHWFDRSAAATELYRVLKPGGWLVIAHFDWIPLPGNVANLTEALIRRFNPEWRFHGGHGVYPHWLTDAAIAGFVDIRTRTYDEGAVYSHQAWRGRVRASAGIAASLAPGDVKAFDTALAKALTSDFPTDPLTVHHRISTLVARKPAA